MLREIIASWMSDSQNAGHWAQHAYCLVDIWVKLQSLPLEGLLYLLQICSPGNSKDVVVVILCGSYDVVSSLSSASQPVHHCPRHISHCRIRLGFSDGLNATQVYRDGDVESMEGDTGTFHTLVAGCRAC